MKRVLSLVLAFMLVMTSILPAFAEEAMASDAAMDLMSYGIIDGTDMGADEDVALTRAMMAKILADLNGVGETAGAYPLPASFTDLVEGAWYVPYVAYAEAQGWMIGGGVGSAFRPDDVMNAQEMNTLLVRVLGYNDAWETVNAEAEMLGIAVVAADSTAVLRGEAFASMRAMLDVPAMDATVTLGEALELENYMPPAPPAPEALEVVSVEAINLVQTEITFNQAVDADTAEDAGNYTMTDADDNDVAIADAELLEDGMTVVLTHANMGQQGEAIVDIEDVEDLEENAMADFTSETVEFLDTVIPTVIDLEVVGNDTLKVTFSEPMTTGTLTDEDNYEVDGGDLYIDTVTAVNNNTEANITLYSDLEEGEVTVKVLAGVQDEANFGVIQNTLEATVTADADGPVVVDYKDVTTTTVTLIFNEEVELSDDPIDADDFYHTNGNNPVDTAVLSDNGKELTLTWAEGDELPEGTAYVYVIKETVNDLWDNDNNQIMVEVMVELDETAPVVESDVTVETETQIVLEFDEPLDQDIAEDEDNYTLLDDEGEEVEDIIEDITYAANKVTIDFDSELSGEYTIVIENIEDNSENVMADTTLAFEVDDLTAPVAADFSATIYNAGTTGQMVKISFGEEMATEGEYSIADIEKYQIAGNILSELAGDVVLSVVDGGKAVEIEIAPDEETDGIDIAAATNAVVVARVADAADNYTLAFTNTFDLDAAATVGIEKVEATSVDTIVVTFDDLLDEFDAADVIITTDITDGADADTNADDEAEAAELSLSKRSLSVNSDGNSVLTLTLVADLDYVAESAGNTVYVYVPTTVTSANEYSETIALGGTMVADSIAPVLFDDGLAADAADILGDYVNRVNDDIFDVVFSEEMDLVNAGLAGNDFVVTADGDVLLNGVDFQINGVVTSGLNVANDSYQFQLIGDYVGFDGEIEVELASTVNYVYDASTNENAPEDFTTDEFVVYVLPTLVSAEFTSATTLEIVFSEAVTALATDFTDGKFLDNSNADNAETFTVSSISGSGTDTIILTIAGSVAIESDDVTASVDIAATVLDLAGNALNALDDEAVASGF